MAPAGSLVVPTKGTASTQRYAHSTPKCGNCSRAGKAFGKAANRLWFRRNDTRGLQGPKSDVIPHPFGETY